MYPSPASLYHPQASQQPSQLISQTTTQNIHSSPPPSSAATSSTYPYSQYNHTSNAVTSGLPGQPPFPSPTMPSTTAGNIAGATNHQNNNLHGPPSVSIMKRMPL